MNELGAIRKSGAVSDEREDHLTLSLPGPWTAGRVEKRCNELFSDDQQWRMPVVIDFAKAQFVEMATTIYLLALLRNRQNDNLPTRFGLPQNQSVWNYLRVMQFPEAVEIVANTRFDNMVSAEDQGRLEELETGYRPPRLTTDPDGNLVTLLTLRKFFSIRAYQNPMQTPLVQMESAKWRDPLLVQFLEKHLSDTGKAGDIEKTQIYEALANAKQHSGAKTVLVASQLVYPDDAKDDSKSKPTHLSIAVWDDGVSVLTTLRNAASQSSLRGQLVHTNPREFILDKFLLGYDAETHLQTYPPFYNPQVTDPDEVLLMACFMPGVTQKIANPSANRNVGVDSASKYEDPGMGLFTLLRTTILDFGGTINLRTGQYTLEAKRVNANLRSKYKSDAKFHIAVTKHQQLTPGFLGNMLTIRTPLNAK